MSDAGGKGDHKAVDAALRDINDEFRPLAQRSRKAAQRTDDPETQKRIERALNDVSAAIPAQQEAARELARNPKDPAKKAKLDDVNNRIANDLDALTDALADAAQSVPEFDTDLPILLTKAQDETKGVEAAARNASETDVARAVKDVKDTFAKIVPKAKRAAQNSPHAYAEPRIAQALHELQYYLIPVQEESAQRAAQNPKDDSKKAQLKEATHKVYDGFEEIRDALLGICFLSFFFSMDITHIYFRGRNSNRGC